MEETQDLLAPDITEPSSEKVTKETIRFRVWDHLVEHKIAIFPDPYGRIPNFKGCDLATEKLKELDIFQNAKCVEVNPDKALEAVRKLVLESRKDLYVASPHIKGCLLKKLEYDGTVDINKVVARWGIDNTGRKIGIDYKIHIDLVVFGSVAVSKDGYRIGKGRGFADLEFALLKEMKAIDDKTVIVTLVHDSQVFDTLPTDLFRMYDVPIDYIITPTTVKKIEHTLAEPTGVYWNMLTKKRLKRINVLKTLKKKHESEGRDTTLATVEEKSTPTPTPFFRFNRYFKKKRKLSKPKPNKSAHSDEPVSVGMSEKQVLVAPAPQTVTKEMFRKKVWKHFRKSQIGLSSSLYQKIPPFKGIDLAVERLKELEVFKNANFIAVNPIKLLETVRILILESGKHLYIPTTGIEDCLFRKPELNGVSDVKKVVKEYGRKLHVDEKVRIDLLVIGSVAVSKDGYRIGKGKGFDDLRFAILKELATVDDDTIIVTLVHDSQVFDELPRELFKKYDVPVDYIITPTTIRKVEVALPKPTGIYWDMLTEKGVRAIGWLEKLKKKRESEGIAVTLATVDNNSDNKTQTGPAQSDERKPTKSQRRVTKSSSSKLKLVGEKNAARENNRNEANKENTYKLSSPINKKKKKKKKATSDYSLHVSNIKKSARVRDLRNALVEKDIRPNGITWKGFDGYCFLHYAKSNRKATAAAAATDVEAPFAIDDVIEKIQKLNINPDMNNLNVKVVEPITRIETMNITAV